MFVAHPRHGNLVRVITVAQDGKGQYFSPDLARMDEAMCNLGYDVQVSLLGPALLTIPPFCK